MVSHGWKVVSLLCVLIGGIQVAQALDSGRSTDLDPRLQTRVSVWKRAVSLCEALQEMSKQSGVWMRPSEEVAELRVSLFVRGIPLGTLQERLAELLHLTWQVEEMPDERSGPAYLLYKSARDRAEERRLLERGERAFGEGIENAIRGLDLSPKELERLKETHPSLYRLLTTPTTRAATGLLAQLSPPQRGRLLGGVALRIPLSAATPAQQAAVLDLFRGVRSPDARTPTIHGSDGVIEFRKIDQGAQALIVVSASYANMMSGCSVWGTNISETYPDLEPPKRTEEEYAAARRLVPLRVGLTGATVDEQLEQIAEALGIHVLAESYLARRSILEKPIEFGQTTLERILDTILTGYTLWWKRGDIYLVQDKLWFLRRQAQIPEPLLLRMRALLKQKPLALEDWGELGRLRPQQCMMLQTLGLGELDTFVLHEYPLMAFYGSLSRMHQGALFARGGLDAARLRREDRERLIRWLAAPEGEGMRELRVFAAVEANGTRFWAVASRAEGRIEVLREQKVSAIPRAAKKTKW